MGKQKYMTRIHVCKSTRKVMHIYQQCQRPSGHRNRTRCMQECCQKKAWNPQQSSWVPTNWKPFANEDIWNKTMRLINPRMNKDIDIYSSHQLWPERRHLTGLLTKANVRKVRPEAKETPALADLLVWLLENPILRQKWTLNVLYCKGAFTNSW